MPKVLKVNMVFVVLGMIVFSAIEQAFALNGEKTGGAVFIGLYCLMLALQVFVNILLLIISLIRRDGQFKFYLLSIVVVPLIGFPLCLGGANLFGG